MDDRQVEGIKEGAGREESRINQDFVDFLKVWGPRGLWLIVIISGGWWAFQQYQRYQVGRANDAFAEYEAVAGAANPLPASLRAVAEEYQDVGSVSALAQLRLGDVHLAAVRRGLEPAAVLDANGNPEDEADVLDEAGRDDHLSRAASAYRAAIELTSSDAAKAILTVSGHFGLAAVAESRGENDEAKSQYERASAIAEQAGLAGLPEIAAERITSLDALPADSTLPSAVDLPVLPGFPAPDIVPTDDADGAEPAPSDGPVPDTDGDTESDPSDVLSVGPAGDPDGDD
ncbi:MAG: hypothetical protein AAGI53_08095 [Planctomycetota bacterium]